MTDIVDRLKDRDAIVLAGLYHAIPTMRAAADEIERLRKLLEQATYSMCTGDYKEQEAVAQSIKTEMQR